MNCELHHNCTNCTIIASQLHHKDFFKFVTGSKSEQPSQFASTFKNRTISTQPKFLKELIKPAQVRISIFFPPL